MSDSAFANGVIRPALFVGGCIFVGLTLFSALWLALEVISVILDSGAFPGEIFGYPPAEIVLYVTSVVAFGTFSLAMLRGSGVRWVREIPLLGAASTRVLVLVGVVASLPMVLTIALILSIILSGGLD